MADFALWSAACETALWSAGTFNAAYQDNRNEAVRTVVEADPLASAIRQLMETMREWAGTASDLLGALAGIVGERVAKAKSWPQTPRALSGCLRRAATPLRKLGIDVTKDRTGRARTIHIKRVTEGQIERVRNFASLPSFASCDAEPAYGNNGIGHDANRDGRENFASSQNGFASLHGAIASLDDANDDGHDDRENFASCRKSLIAKLNDGTDANDAKIPAPPSTVRI
jgi:hypothetical protein